MHHSSALTAQRSTMARSWITIGQLVASSGLGHCPFSRVSLATPRSAQSIFPHRLKSAPGPVQPSYLGQHYPWTMNDKTTDPNRFTGARNRSERRWTHSSEQASLLNAAKGSQTNTRAALAGANFNPKKGTLSERGVNASRPRPTHFLSLPLGHHPFLREKLSSFRTSLLESVPPIKGLDKKISVDPRRLHFTLGVMSLSAERRSPEQQNPLGSEARIDAFVEEDASGTQARNTDLHKTVEDALALLQTLKPGIRDIQRTSQNVDDIEFMPLRVPLSTMGVLKTNKHGDANVLWIGPNVDTEEMDEELRKLLQVCYLVHNSFKEAGFITEKRPLKLHCTLVNTSHRKPMGRPFSYRDILRSKAVQDISVVAGDNSSPLSAIAVTSSEHEDPERNYAHLKTIDIDLGSWPVDEIQLCAMGSHGPENEYVSCGGIRLV